MGISTSNSLSGWYLKKENFSNELFFSLPAAMFYGKSSLFIISFVISLAGDLKLEFALKFMRFCPKCPHHI
jgi:hypothetical protein